MDQMERRASKGLLDHWQLIILTLTGAVGFVRFYYTVQDLADSQKQWQRASEERRERSHDALDSLDNRLIKVEKDIEWLKGRK